MMDELSVLGRGDPLRISSGLDFTNGNVELTAVEGGGFVAVWSVFGGESEDGDVYVQIFDGAGHTLGDPFFANEDPVGVQSQADVTWLPDGGFAVTWRDQMGGLADQRVEARLFDADGTPRTDDFLVGGGHAYGIGPMQTATWNDGFVVVYSAGVDPLDFNQTDVFGRSFEADGTPVTPNVRQLNQFTTDSQYAPSVAALTGGRLLVAYESAYEKERGYERDVYNRIVAADGTLLEEFDADTRPNVIEFAPAVAGLNNGNAVVVWAKVDSDEFGNGLTRAQIRMQIIDKKGDFVTPIYDLTADEANSYGRPDVTWLADGGFAVVWQKFGGSAVDVDVILQIHNEDGSVRTPAFSVPGYGAGDVPVQPYPSVEGLPDGNILVSWTADDPETEGYEVFVQAFAPDGGLPSLNCGLRLIGDSADDELQGGGCDDSVDGRGGSDTLMGAEGNDTLEGSSGGDRLEGGDGSDDLYGGKGSDKLYGDKGNDRLQGDAGNDLLLPGAGADVIVFGVGDGKDVVRGFENKDQLLLDPGLWDGDLSSGKILRKFAEVTDDGVLLDFGRDELLIEGVDRVDQLRDDIDFA